MYGELPVIETTTPGETIRGFPVRILSPEKTAVLRLPTSAELLVYMAAQRSIYRDLGRQMGEGEEVPTPKADLALFKAIRIDTGDSEFDEAEALYAIGLITKHKVTSCERDGQAYVVKVATMFGETAHTVSIPFQKDLAEYRRNVYRARDMPNGIEERRFPPDVPVKLYDKIVQDAAGYLDTIKGNAESFLSVPPHHKRTVVQSVLSALALLDPGLDPNL